MLGHDGPPQQFWRENLLSKKPLLRCPVREVQLLAEAHPAIVAEMDRYVDDYYPAYDDGHLLVKGGITDQPARYVQLIGLVRNIERATDARYLELKTENTT